MSKAAIALYTDLVTEAIDAQNAATQERHMRAFYTGHPDLAFLRVLSAIREVDVMGLPAAKVLDLARATIFGGELGPRDWFEPALNAAREEFQRYKNHVACALSDFTDCMAATGEFEIWAGHVKLTDLQTVNCAMWRRIRRHRFGLSLSILHTQLAHRLQQAKLQPEMLLPESHENEATQCVWLSNVQTFMAATLAVAKKTLRSAWRESIHMRISRMCSQPRPTDLITKSSEIPNFAPSLVDLKEARAHT